ncbi:MAG: hypothetical protein AAGA54_13305 [Myxococcota bacterium]
MADRGPTPSDPLRSLGDAMLELFEDSVPAVLQGVPAAFSTDEVFDWVRTVHTPAQCSPAASKIDAVKRSWGLSPDGLAEADGPPRPIELYRGGGVLLDPSPFVPTSEHDDLGAWIEAVRPSLGEDFGVMAPHLERASWDALERLQTLLGPTLGRTGSRSYRYNAFFGDYRRTPFGFHLDPHQECVFQFVLSGTRRASFWEGLFLGREDTGWIEDPNGRATPTRRPDMVVDLEPGDLVFWPGTHVHGFETDGPSMALSLVIDRTSPRSRDDVIAGLEIATVGGRTALPPVTEGVSLNPDAPLRQRPNGRLAFEFHDDDLIIGVCGRTFVWPDPGSHAVAVKLLEAVRREPDLSPNDLSKRFHGKSLDRDDIHGVLATLAELGYFTSAR